MESARVGPPCGVHFQGLRVPRCNITHGIGRADPHWRGQKRGLRASCVDTAALVGSGHGYALPQGAGVTIPRCISPRPNVLQTRVKACLSKLGTPNSRTAHATLPPATGVFLRSGVYIPWAFMCVVAFVCCRSAWLTVAVRAKTVPSRVTYLVCTLAPFQA